MLYAWLLWGSQVIEENTIVSEVTFSESATGASILQGQFISAATGESGGRTGWRARTGCWSIAVPWTRFPPMALAHVLASVAHSTAPWSPNPVPSRPTTTGSKPLSTGPSFPGYSRESREVTLRNGTWPFHAACTTFTVVDRSARAFLPVLARRTWPGRSRISTVASSLKLNPHHVEAAQRLFMLAMQHNFIQGRRTQNVVAACLYIVCRRERTSRTCRNRASGC